MLIFIQKFYKMSEFQLWFAYYDSFFIQPNPQLRARFYRDHILSDVNWPIQLCHPLASIYIQLQSFLRNPQSWDISKCQLSELESIQNELDNLMHFLHLEKSYAHSYWREDPRRIEASTVHFYTFLQLFIRAIIPYPTMNLFECKTANKLCIKIKKLQNLMNEILKRINPIANFLSHPKFAEQSKLIQNFFENWIYFMKKLPNIKRNKLNHVHKLAKFLYLTNPIQICIMNKSLQYAQAIRKKSNTVGTQFDIHSFPPENRFPYNPRIILGGELIQKEQRRSHSCVSLVIRNEGEDQLLLLNEKKLFNFPPIILQYAKEEEVRNKATTVSSLSTLQNKKASLSKLKTLTTTETLKNDNKNMEISPKKKRDHTKSTSQNRKMLKSSDKIINLNSSLYIRATSNQRRQTLFYERETERNQDVLSMRSSRQSSIRKREITALSINKIESPYMPKKKEVQFYEQPKYNLTQMKIKKSKWDIVRAMVHERIRMRKLKRILES